MGVFGHRSQNAILHFFGWRQKYFSLCLQIKEEQMKPKSQFFATVTIFLLLMVGCKPPATQQAEGNIQVFFRSIEAINSKHFDDLNELGITDFVRHCQATPDVTVNSLEDFKRYLRQDSATFPDSRLSIAHVFAEGNWLAFHGTYVGTQRGPMGPFPPSNKQMSIEIAGIQRFENGKIAEMWVTWDNLTALIQLGHFPPPTQERN
jgi:predicted ester cyclase